MFVCFREKHLREVLQIVLWVLTAMTAEASYSEAKERIRELTLKLSVSAATSDQ